MTDRQVALRIGPLSRRLGVRAMAVYAAMAVAAAACVLLALTVGRHGLSPAELVTALSPDATPRDRLILGWRAPRALAAVLFGACLGISGAIFQGLTRNPLGSPDVIGLNAGAYTGVIAVILVGGSGYAATATGAVLGSLGAAAAVYLLSRRGGVRGFRLIIIGIAVSAILQSVNYWFGVKADLDEALQAAIWGAGTLSSMQWRPLGAAAAVALVAAAALPTVGRRMRQLDLGDEAAAMLGVRVERTQALLVLVGVVFTAVVTAVTGPIAFIALAAPQIARRLAGRGASLSLTGSALVGAVLLASADLVAQYLIPGAKPPVGAVTVILGGAYLVWLLIRESSRA